MYAKYTTGVKQLFFLFVFFLVFVRNGRFGLKSFLFVFKKQTLIVENSNEAVQKITRILNLG